MKYIEITLGLKLKSDIHIKDLPAKLSRGINEYFRYTEMLSDYHKANKFKLYTFSHLIPVERDKIYKKGRCYNLILRFMNLEILNDFMIAIHSIENDVFSVVANEYKVVNNDRKIKSIKTVTPAVLIKDYRNLDLEHMDLNLVKDRLNSNTIKKYKLLNNITSKDKINHNFIKDIKVLNKKSSITFNYKNSFILGNMFEIEINEDDFSQELAFIVLGSGALEKNSLSFGFSNIAGDKL